MRVGIFFGGPSREREISFAGGRTVYDNLDKALFTPVPIFVDSTRRWIKLDWSYLYKGTIRDFYPPVDYLPDSPHQFQVYIESLSGLSESAWADLVAEVGEEVTPNEIGEWIDFAFLALHGVYGEDGQIQGLLESLQIPYSGSGIRACSIGMDKAYQKKLMAAGDFTMPAMHSISRKSWLEKSHAIQLETITEKVGFPLVVRPANQGSSIGVQIVQDASGLEKAVDAAFFREEYTRASWLDWDEEARIQVLRHLTDIRTGLGFPLHIEELQQDVYHPEALWSIFERVFVEDASHEVLTLAAHQTESEVVAEAFIEGREFSCVVLRQEDERVTALPPTEIRKIEGVFDYRSKYLAGLSRKVTPIDLPLVQIEAIRAECVRLFEYLEFQTYARIDGFIQADGTIILNDPNTTSGMLPSSFFFHQAAEIGLNPSQFITYIIRTSLQERIRTSLECALYDDLLQRLDWALDAQKQQAQQKQKIAVLLGGYSAERHISVESGRNIYEKLASSTRYTPVPVFLTGQAQAHALYQLPIALLLKDNADDIRDKVLAYQTHPLITKIQKECAAIREKYASPTTVQVPKALSYEALAEEVDAVFIALHGRPGEDGEVQHYLKQLGVPFNGSEEDSAKITIDKYETLQRLKSAGFPVANQFLAYQSEYQQDLRILLDRVEWQFTYPLIVKPVDDGCSAAVKLVRTRDELADYLRIIFRETEPITSADRACLKLSYNEEFPQKKVVLIEQRITKENAAHFLEITGGLLTHYDENGTLAYEVFEPSEALAGGEVLSLEEKFLAGEGQNITPARFVPKNKTWTHNAISAQVRDTLERAAKLLGVTGYARIDAFVRIYEDGRAETIIIEVNALPGMTPATCIFHQAALNGYKPFEFIDKIVQFGQARERQIL